MEEARRTVRDPEAELCVSDRENSRHEKIPDMNDRLIDCLLDLNRTMRFLYEGKGSQKRVLIVLYEAGGNITQKELTQKLGIQPGSASEVIMKLEEAGYLKRTPGAADRRTAEVVLTKTGREAAAEAKKQRMLRHGEMFSCLSGEEKIRFLSLLEKINADWEKRYPAAGKRKAAVGRPQRGRQKEAAASQKGE